MVEERARAAQAAGGHWVVRFISGKYQGSEVPLNPGKELVVGRASNTDLVLVEDMVSRKHAKIAVVEGEATIQDLGSTNGTFVNGEKVKRAKLKDGDRVLIGTSILKVMRQEQPAVASLQPVADSKSLGASTLRPGPLQGDIGEHGGLASVVQLLATSKQSGVLDVRGDQHGEVFFKEGKIIRSLVRGVNVLTAKKALYRVFSWTNGTFTLGELRDPDFKPEFKETSEALVNEAMKQADELRRARERLPSGVRHFQVRRPLSPPLKDLSPKRLDTFQLVMNKGDLGSVLDRNNVSDLDSYRHLLFLLQKEYIEVAAR